MEVILREHVDNLGRRGDIVKVAAGYARNYLLPRKLALAVNDDNKRQIEREREGGRGARARGEVAGGSVRRAARAGRHRDRAPRRRERHAVRVGDVGRHRAGAARRRASRSTSARSQLADPFKALGEYTVPVKVHRDVTAQVKVKVVAEQKSK